MDAALIEVFVAVGMAGAKQGQHRWVDPNDPYIARRLELGYLQRVATVGEPEPEAEPVTDPDPNPE